MYLNTNLYVYICIYMKVLICCCVFLIMGYMYIHIYLHLYRYIRIYKSSSHIYQSLSHICVKAYTCEPARVCVKIEVKPPLVDILVSISQKSAL